MRRGGDQERRERRARRLVRLYPRAWRARYGPELTALLVEDLGERPLVPGRFLDLLRCAAHERLADAGFVGAGEDPRRQLRASVGIVWLAMAAFLAVGLTVFSQLTVDWQWADPRTPPAVAGMWLMAGALLAIAPLLLLAIGPVLVASVRAVRAGRGRALAVPALLALGGAVLLAYGSHRLGVRWPGTGGHRWNGRGLVPAPIARSLWAGSSWFSTFWLHPGWLASLPAEQLLWMVLSPVALIAAVTGTGLLVRRVALGDRAMRWEALGAGAGLVAMVVFLAGAGSWVLGRGAPIANLAQPGAIDDLAVALMTAALLAASAAARRAVRAGRVGRVGRSPGR